jgi:quercetin dioxygenase-like cupin family protein
MNASSDGGRVRALWVAGMLAALAAVAGQGVHAEEAKPDAVVASLLKKELADIPGKEVVMVTVEYPPGGASAAHRHDAHVFVYVLAGALRMQVDGAAPVTLQTGETFYESPADVHRVSANASDTEPVKFLVLMVKDEGKPGTRPVERTP